MVQKTWDGIKTFTGEITGYYDYIRASEGVDPVTGEELTTGQRVAKLKKGQVDLEHLIKLQMLITLEINLLLKLNGNLKLTEW